MKFPKDLVFNHCTLSWCTKLPNRIYYITLIVQYDCCAKRYCLICSCSNRIFAFILVHGSHAFKVYFHMLAFILAISKWNHVAMIWVLLEKPYGVYRLMCCVYCVSGSSLVALSFSLCCSGVNCKCGSNFSGCATTLLMSAEHCRITGVLQWAVLNQIILAQTLYVFICWMLLCQYRYLNYKFIPHAFGCLITRPAQVIYLGFIKKKKMSNLCSD